MSQKFEARFDEFIKELGGERSLLVPRYRLELGQFCDLGNPILHLVGIM